MPIAPSLPRLLPASDPACPPAAADRRCLPWREDLADIALKPLGWPATTFIHPTAMRAITATTGLHAAPDNQSEQVSQLLFGEYFHVLEQRPDGWLWGQCGTDGYMGYADASAFAADDTLGTTTQTHWVSVPTALIFSAPSIKSACVMTLPLCARLALQPAEGPFLAVLGATGAVMGFVHRRHVAALDQDGPLGDPVSVAQHYLGTPYLWGGRSHAGLDCSGLVQICLAACGIPAPRDSDQQQALGTFIDSAAWHHGLQRGDLVFFPGHVGLMASDSDLVHANAHWMAVEREPLADVVRRLEDSGARAITAVRRLHTQSGN